MHTFLQDLRFSLRLLRRAPGFTAAAIAVLALGIGANTAIFSLVNELLWSPRLYAHADRVVQLYTQEKKNPSNFRLASYSVYRELAAHADAFDGILAHNLALVGVGEGDTSRRTFAAIVSSNYFSVLGVPLAQGRAFTAEEEKPGAALQTVIVSHLYWEKNGRDPALVGKTLRIDERLFTVVGITPDHFTGTSMLFGPEFYFPLGVYDQLSNEFGDGRRRSLAQNNAFNLFLVGRLKPGVTRDAANAALRTLAANLETAFPVEQKDQTMFAGTLPRLSTSTNPTSEKELAVLGTLLMAMAGIVLLIACLNLANMLLARGAARRKEIAVRLALGGGRARIVRQLLTEGFVLSFAGGVAGLLLALWSAGAFVRSFSAIMPIALFFHGAANPAVFAATLAFCTFATFFFALGPALKLTRADLIGDLKQNPGEDAATRRRSRWLPRHPLVVIQLALSLALLTAAALFVRGALNAARFDTGFHAPNTVIAEVDAALGGYDRPHAIQLYASLTERLAALPGVQAASVGAIVPLGNIQMSRHVRRAGIVVAPDAHPATAAEGRAFDARWTSTGADYFRAMGLPLLQGRAFTPAETDHEGAPPVAIVDETLAKKLFPEGNALGQRIAWSAEKTYEIVGIVAPTRWELFDHADHGCLYEPFAQGYQSNAFFHLAVANASPEAQRALFETVRREIRQAAPSLPLFSVKTFSQHLDASVQLWIVRAGAATFGLFGALALLLAVVGIYGVNAYAVSRRTREIGIRMALGADAGAVRGMILREGLGTTIAGVTLGLLLGAGIGQACTKLLYEVSALDPLAFTLAPLVLGLAAMLACWLPARRATQVNPMVALRAE